MLVETILLKFMIEKEEKMKNEEDVSVKKSKADIIIDKCTEIAKRYKLSWKNPNCKEGGMSLTHMYYLADLPYGKDCNANPLAGYGYYDKLFSLIKGLQIDFVDDFNIDIGMVEAFYKRSLYQKIGGDGLQAVLNEGSQDEDYQKLVLNMVEDVLASENDPIEKISQRLERKDLRTRDEQVKAIKDLDKKYCLNPALDLERARNCYATGNGGLSFGYNRNLTLADFVGHLWDIPVVEGIEIRASIVEDLYRTEVRKRLEEDGINSVLKGKGEAYRKLVTPIVKYVLANPPKPKLRGCGLLP